MKVGVGGHIYKDGKERSEVMVSLISLDQIRSVVLHDKLHQKSTLHRLSTETELIMLT